MKLFIFLIYNFLNFNLIGLEAYHISLRDD